MKYRIPVDSPPGTRCLVQSPGGGCYDGHGATVLAVVNDYGVAYDETDGNSHWRGTSFRLKFDKPVNIGAGTLIGEDSLPMEWCFVPNCPVNYWLRPRKNKDATA